MLVTLLLYMYIFFLSFSGAFVVSSWFPLHVILLLAAVLLSLPRQLSHLTPTGEMYHFEDIFIYVGIMALIISGLIHPNDKTVNYLLAYFYVFGVGYFLLKHLLRNYGSMEKYLDINAVAVFIVALYAVCEVSADYLTGFDIQTFMPRIKDATATYSTTFKRAYAFCTEPTILAYYLNTMGPVALWRIWRYRRISSGTKYIVTALLITACIFTFSPAGIVAMVVSVTAVSLIRLQDVAVRRKCLEFGNMGTRAEGSYSTATVPFGHLYRRMSSFRRISLTLLVGLAITAFVAVRHNRYHESIATAADPLIRKILLQGHSAEARVAGWSYAMENMFSEPLFGKGIGYLSSRDSCSSTSWYLFLAMEGGFIASGCFIVFLMLSLWRILKSHIAAKYWFLTGFLCAALHFNVISTIHHPYLWVLLALFNLVQSEEEQRGVL